MTEKELDALTTCYCSHVAAGPVTDELEEVAAFWQEADLARQALRMAWRRKRKTLPMLEAPLC